ncbi:replication protein A 70 kDa DNA-binding subunit [Artemisia annua]|uniref:Replication protein A 70 kDa DNA-binding subunit n=1 Tax=Artemisia annua TaxID=35608 RepID=A0A2U1L3S2_ARTAN|nr:replication protein A 70 kDa DNA-binding subunit [Artemisia annua]
MPINPRSVVLDDLQSIENYMYNLNGTHVLDLQPPPELNAVEQQKWVEKQNRYRRRKTDNMQKNFGNSYCCTSEATCQPKPMRQHHEVGFCKDPNPCTVPKKTNEKDLQRDERLPQHPLVNNQFMNINQDHCKGKTPICDPPTFETGKKKKEVFQDVTYSFIFSAFPYSCTDLTTENWNMQLPPGVFSSESVSLCRPNTSRSPDTRSNLKQKKVPISTDEGCSQVQQHSVASAAQFTSGPQLPHQQSNIENQTQVRSKTSATSNRRRKRQNIIENQINDTSMEQLKKQRTNTNSLNSSTETQNEGLPITNLYTSISHLYIDLGDADYTCQYRNATFWSGEKLKGNCHRSYPKYTKCCGGGQLASVKTQTHVQYKKTNEKDLQRDERLPQHPLVNNQFMNINQDHCKGKTPICDPPTFETGEKKEVFQHVTYSFIFSAFPYSCTDLTTENWNMQLPPGVFSSESVSLCRASTSRSPDTRSNLKQKKVPVFTDEGCSQVQQHSVASAAHFTSGPQLPHQQSNIENQIQVRSKTSATSNRRRKRQNIFENQINDTSMEQLKKQRTNTNSLNSSTETQNEGLPINNLYTSISHLYIDLGDADYTCQYCNATFWYGEKLKGNCHRSYPKYTKCCGGGQVYLRKERDPPEFFKILFRDKHFLDNSGLKPEIVQTLIHILDDNNELVQVFRTTRDRIEEGNVPEFKIQLYNVSGAQEYQLPSSGTLGGIVFQPDPNSHTDYDMIVEYRDRQPKRINKLHSSYMSLQFPLLFVYGQLGYNTKMTLKPMNGGKKRTKLTMNIMTESTIRELTPTSRNRILEAKVYRSWIGRNPPDITERSYHAILLDRQLTLWDDLAETFPKERIDALEKPIIIAVSSCRVARFRNNLQLSSTQATYYYINPEIPELPQYKAEYKAAFDLNPPLQIVRHPYQDKEREKMRNRIPFSKLLAENPLTHTDVRFTCDGTITGLDTSREWYYPSCATCPNKIQVNEGVIECKIHGALLSPTYRYNFKAYVTDPTATITMTFFSPKADDIVGVKCETLVNSLQNPDPREFPEKILAPIGKRHIFQFHYNTNSRQGPVTFILYEILDKPDAQTHIKDKPSGTAIESSQTIEKNVPEAEQTVTALEYTPSTELAAAPSELPSPASVVPVAEADLPTSIMSASETAQITESQDEEQLQQEDASEIPPTAAAYTYMQTRSRHGKQVAGQVAGTATPPPTQEDLTKPSTKAYVPEPNKGGTAKRQLFQEKQGDGKKIKKNEHLIKKKTATSTDHAFVHHMFLNRYLQ